MLVSLGKVLIFVTLIVALIFGVDFLMREGEGLRLAVADTEYTLGPVQTVIAGILLLVAVWLVLKVLGLALACLRFLAGDETAITRYFARSRERRGFTALAEGLTALASGDGSEAMQKATKAERLLARPDLTNLIKAQAAEMSGNRDQATEAYKRLLEDNRTRFVGVRGLMKQKLAEGDTDTALKLAEKAFVLKPRHTETTETLLRLQAKHENWRGARKTLGAEAKYGAVPKDVHRRRDAVLALCESRQKLAAGDVDGARDEAIGAARLSPALVPAAVMAAQAYTEMGKPRNAAKVIRTAWHQNPHPELAAAYAAIAPDESPEHRIRRFSELTRNSPDDPETRMLMAELYVAAEDFPAARKALGTLPETDPTARALTLMAAIERGMGADDSEVKAWLARALTSSRGPQWTCENCGKVHRAWAPICSQCDAFDTLSWKTPADEEVITDHSAAMLPLIVGAIEPAPEAPPVEDPAPSGDIIEDPIPDEDAKGGPDDSADAEKKGHDQEDMARSVN
ncbi:MAG: heme biosynthesis protein HemY [Qingshengfaniella sp.]